MSSKPKTSMVRSSAAEYLTFIAASGHGGVEAIYADENVWLTQKMMGQLYDVETHTINYHLKKVFSDSELQEAAVIRNFRITAADSKSYDTNHYNLVAIIAVGYKVNSERAVLLSDLFTPMKLGWKARTQKENALMVDLIPLLHKLAQGQEISGLRAYEQ